MPLTSSNKQDIKHNITILFIILFIIGLSICIYAYVQDKRDFFANTVWIIIGMAVTFMLIIIRLGLLKEKQD